MTLPTTNTGDSAAVAAGRTAPRNGDSPHSPLLDRDFLLLVAGQGISLFGNMMLRFAMSMWVLDETGSAASFASILAVSIVPTILLSPFGGVLADRVNRRTIMVALDALSAALATHGDIFVKGATQPEMMTFLNVFRKIGGEFDITDKGIRFWHPGGDLKPVAIETDVHPGFMTDWQQPLVVALTQANGLSIVHETVYENRFGFTKPLVQMGATIQLYRECLGSLPCRFQQRNYKHSAVIFGPTPLTGRDIEVPDLRGGFSHLIAALAASGPSDVHGISLIDRGYADFRGKLTALGADID